MLLGLYKSFSYFLINYKKISTISLYINKFLLRKVYFNMIKLKFMLIKYINIIFFVFINKL